MIEREELLKTPLVTRSKLVEDLRRLGLLRGQVVMLHASVSAIGWVVGGPDMVLQAILDVLGPEGNDMAWVEVVRVRGRCNAGFREGESFFTEGLRIIPKGHENQLISVGDSIDTSSSNGKLLFHILSAIAEYERELLIKRTKAGRALAERQAKVCHRPRKEIDPKVLREMKRKGVSHQMMARTLGVSRATILKRLDELGLR